MINIRLLKLAKATAISSSTGLPTGKNGSVVRISSA
jgi:hypothetical protein